MISVEEKIKESLNYEVKTTASSILTEYNFRKNKSKKSFPFFKLLYGGLGLAAMGAILITSINLANRNKPVDDNPITIIKPEEIINLNAGQKEKINQMAHDLMPAVSLVELIECSNIQVLSNTRSFHDVALSEFNNLTPFINQMYEDDYNFTLTVSEYKISGREKLFYSMVKINDDVKIYFDEDISLETYYEDINGVIELSHNDDYKFYDVSKTSLKDYDKIEINLGIDKKIVITKESNSYLYRISLNRDRLYELSILWDDSKLTVDNKKYDYLVKLTFKKNLNNSSTKINYYVIKENNQFNVNYCDRNSESTNGNFTVSI